MKIENIEWLDIDEKEAVITVSNNYNKLICFSCPCDYQIGDELTEQLECLDTKAVAVCDKCDSITKLESVFGYKLQGRIIDAENGIVAVDGFVIHIDEKEIPGDVNAGMYIQFDTSRVDVW